MSNKPNKDSITILEKENAKLKKVLRQKDKTIKQLKSEVNTAEQALRRTETYLKEVTDGRSLSEILKTVEANKPLRPIEGNCPDCRQSGMKKIIFTGFHIISCKCGYRNRVDEEREIKKN